MSIRSALMRAFGRDASAREVRKSSSGEPKVDFTASSSGREQRLVWSRYQQPWNIRHSPYSITAGGFVTRERAQAAAIATEFTTSNPVVATIIENSTTHAVGTGLTLSSKLDANALGISPDEARKLASDIEKAWRRYAGNPLEVDATGRHDLHELAAASFESYMRHGESLAVIDWKAVAGSKFRSKVVLLDPAQLDARKTHVGPQPDDSTFQGVTFDGNGRVKGYWIVPVRAGHYIQTQQPTFVESHTPWGRRKVVHLFPLRTPGQVRGLTPLTASLTPAQEKSTLGEFTLDAALLQTQYALTVESDLPSAVALAGLRTGDDGLASGVSADNLDARLAHYAGAPIEARPGVINHLAQGDKLKINRSDTPNSTYESFDKSLTRQTAKAAGLAYEDVSGDYADVNFSASRMASETPHRINLRRRKAITEQFYRAVFACWLEEAIEVGHISLPERAPPFYAAKDAYTQSNWLGWGRIQPDPLKAAQATKLELELGLTTLTDALAERGRDFETVVEERKVERDAIRAAGLIGQGENT